MKVTFDEWLSWATKGTAAVALAILLAVVLAFAWGFVQLLGGDDEATADAQEAQRIIHSGVYTWASVVFLGRHPFR